MCTWQNEFELLPLVHVLLQVYGFVKFQFSFITNVASMNVIFLEGNFCFSLHFYFSVGKLNSCIV